VARVKSVDVSPLVKLLCEDRRYKLEAYKFVRDGLSYAQDVLGLGSEVTGQKVAGGEPKPTARRSARKPRRSEAADENAPRRTRHISGQELCVALKHLAADEYGLMAKLVLAGWGIRATSDFGEIVYNLIRIGEMSKSNGDRREDFDDVYDFDQALVREFAITKES